jgi:glycosyltransferase involved in cell wall biosynthesis
MISYADIVLTASKPLYDLRKTQHPYVHLVRNACNYDLTQKYTDMPVDLNRIKKPILLFSGALARDWCDIELVERIAKMSQYSVVVVGLPWGISIPSDIIYLGAKSYTDLQKYYNNCVLTLLPFRRCQISDYSNPIKMYESLAAGKPVISTDLPEACEYPGVVFTSKDHDGFIKNIKKALAFDKTQFAIKAKTVAQENTWDIRYQQIIKAIEEYCEKEDIII